MVRMARNSPLWTEGKHHVGTKAPHRDRQLINHPVYFLSIELPIGIIEHYRPRNSQDLTGIHEFLPADRGELRIALRSATMRASLSGRQADNRRFHAPIAIKPQRSTKAAGFVVGMSGDTHQPQHDPNCTLCTVSQ